MGTLPGKTDEDITILAHMDGYFQAALDNGSGLAVMMGLLEHFAKVPRPSGGATSGSSGRPATTAVRAPAGSTTTRTALAKTALAINLEHVAAVRTKYWGPSCG